MNSEKYIGLHVHQATISVAVLDHSGKVVMECILETKAATILDFFAGLRGTLSVTFEEGTSAAWLYDLLRAPAGSDSFVASTAASIATGLSEPVPGRELHPLKSSAFSRRTVTPTKRHEGLH